MSAGAALADYVRLRDGGICVYCNDAVGQDIEHVIPIHYNGPTIKENLVLSCASCNLKKRRSLDDRYLVPAFRHLLAKGESLAWLDDKLERLDSDQVVTCEAFPPKVSATEVLENQLASVERRLVRLRARAAAQD